MRLKRGLVLLGFRERLRRRSRRAHRVEREHAEHEEGPARALREGALRGLRALGLLARKIMNFPQKLTKIMTFRQKIMKY